MNTFYSNIARGLLGVFLLFFATVCIAHNKVVIIPMLGDSLEPLGNVVTVAKQNGDFTDPVEAIASIQDASATNPYLLVIAPGIYDLGSEQLIMKQFVEITGSGQNATVLKGTGNSGGGAYLTYSTCCRCKQCEHPSFSDREIEWRLLSLNWVI